MHKNWGSCYLKIFKPSKSWWFPPVSAGAFFVSDFLGVPASLCCMKVIAKYCNYVFKRSGILHRDRPKKQNPRFVSRFSWCFFTLLLNLVFLGKNVSFPQNAKNFERLSNTEGRPSFVPESWCYLGQVILWESINRPSRITRTTNLRTVKRMGPFNLLGENPLNISTILRTSPWIRFFFKFTSVLTCDSPNTPFCNSLPTKKDIPFHHSSGTRNDRSAQVVVSSKICSCALKPDDRHLLMVSSTRSLGVEVGDKFMTSKVNWLVTNPDLESFQSVKVVCAS